MTAKRGKMCGTKSQRMKANKLKYFKYISFTEHRSIGFTLLFCFFCHFFWYHNSVNSLSAGHLEKRVRISPWRAYWPITAGAYPGFCSMNRGVARIFQRGGHTLSNIIVMAFSPRNIVGCLLKKGLQRGGGGVTGTPGPPLATPLMKRLGILLLPLDGKPVHRR